MPCGLERLLVEGRRAEAEEKTLFFEWVGIADEVFGELRAAISAKVLYWLENCCWGISWVYGGDLGGDSKHSSGSTNVGREPNDMSRFYLMAGRKEPGTCRGTK